MVGAPLETIAEIKTRQNFLSHREFADWSVFDAFSANKPLSQLENAVNDAISQRQVNRTYAWRNSQANILRYFRTHQEDTLQKSVLRANYFI
jgi:hypothetical protein